MHSESLQGSPLLQDPASRGELKTVINYLRGKPAYQKLGCDMGAIVQNPRLNDGQDHRGAGDLGVVRGYIDV